MMLTKATFRQTQDFEALSVLFFTLKPASSTSYFLETLQNEFDASETRTAETGEINFFTSHESSPLIWLAHTAAEHLTCGHCKVEFLPQRQKEPFFGKSRVNALWCRAQKSHLDRLYCSTVAVLGQHFEMCEKVYKQQNSNTLQCGRPKLLQQ